MTARYSARANPKRVTRAYTPEDRAKGAARVAAVGLAAAHAETGVPRRTLCDWAKAAGVDLGASVRARTAAATAATTARAAEVRLTVVDRLEAVLEEQLGNARTLGVLEHQAGAAVLASSVTYVRGLAGIEPQLDQRARDALAKLRALGEAMPKRDVVGAWTRAVHDLALLKGDATERGDLIVRFGIPRPQTDVVPVPQAELGR